MKRRIALRLLIGGVLLVGASGALWAQATAQISGTVADSTRAVLPGVEVTATQVDTGLTRTAVTNETGLYSLTNLPVGPYRLEAVLPGFSTYAQTGIILQVGASPTINISLQVGQVAQTVEVQADAVMVETRQTGIGNVIDNVRVTELPLNARAITELIILSGASVGGGTAGANRQYPGDVISVGGGMQNGINFLLDGGIHTDPYAGQAMPLPFPDAMQEFKVDTSAVPAQYGFHGAGVVNVVTKSGTNEFHGSVFEFVRNRMFNARNTFAAAKDPLKRNQFGGVIGGPIIRDKLFFFAGFQQTIQRTDALSNTVFIPTARMLAGDWTAFASAQCQSRGAITLGAPFVNNTIDPRRFHPIAVELMANRLGDAKPSDECGTTKFGRRQNMDESYPVGRIDWQISNTHSLFGRFTRGQHTLGSDYDGKTILSISEGDYQRHATSFVLGDTISISPNLVSSFRGAITRNLNEKDLADYFHLGELGVKNYYYPPNFAKMPQIQIAGFGSIGLIGQSNSGRPTPSKTNSTSWQTNWDLNYLRGAHQFGFGVNHVHNQLNYTSSTQTPGRFIFSANAPVRVGSALANFMLGNVDTFDQDKLSHHMPRQNSLAFYFQDTWKVNAKWTMNLGLRWEPYFAPYDDTKPQDLFFSRERFDKGLKSAVFPNFPAGIYSQGEGGIPDTEKLFSGEWKHFAPRVGFAWDPAGNGTMTVRAAYGIFYDTPHLHQYGGRRNNPPRGARTVVRSVSFDDPWASYPGGNPHPLTSDPATAQYPLAASPTIIPWDIPKQYMNQWNMSIQKQFGADWLVAANYIGSSIIHILSRHEGNPTSYVPGVGDASGRCFLNGQQVPYTVAAGTSCSVTGNSINRRALSLAKPDVGKYFDTMILAHGEGTQTYNALWLQVQRRRAAGLTIQGNYTWGHCISDGYTDILQNGGGYLPERRFNERGNCDLDRRHNLNVSTVYEIPSPSSPALQAIFGGWQVSSIVRILSGDTLPLLSGEDTALTDTTQNPNQVLADPYAPNKSMAQWLNPAAFRVPAVGTFGNMSTAPAIYGPGSFRLDMGLTRRFQLKEGHELQFRAEVFNVPNHVNPGNPTTIVTSPQFGQIRIAGDPRIMQMALKYTF